MYSHPANNKIPPLLSPLTAQISKQVYPNPRTQNAAHALDNLNVFTAVPQLTLAEIASLDGAPQAHMSTPACTNPVLTNVCPNNAA